MAHFAQIEDGTVTQVLVVGDDQQHRGQEFLASDLGLGGTWVQTSYNTHGNVHHGSDGEPDGGVALRGNYAGIGYTYNPDLDAFITPQPFPSWALNEDTIEWEAPVPYPDDGNLYVWDEDTTSWVEVE